MSLFRKATKEQAKARIAISGPSGAGKTFTALQIAKVLAQGGKVAVLDTERGSASKYSDLTEFDVAELQTFSPNDYIQVIKGAESEGYAVLVIDSLSHSWAGKGGVLEIVDQEAARSRSGNSYMAWRKGTPEYQKLVDAILGFNGHVIATMRAKTKYEIQDTGRGKAPKRIGMEPVNRDGAEFEYDIFCEMDQEHRLIVSKSRCSAIADGVFEKPGEEFAQKILDWLSDGETPTEHKPLPPVAPTPAPKPAAAEKPAPAPAPAPQSQVSVSEIVTRIKGASSKDELARFSAAAKGLTLSDEDKQTLRQTYDEKLKEIEEASE